MVYYTGMPPVRVNPQKRLVMNGNHRDEMHEALDKVDFVLKKLSYFEHNLETKLLGRVSQAMRRKLVELEKTVEEKRGV